MSEGRTSGSGLEEDSARLWVRVKPRASRDRIVGWGPDGFLEVQLKAVPERGEANRAAGRLIARTLGVAPERVVLEKGHTSRIKRFLLRGVGTDRVRARLGGSPAGGAAGGTPP